VSQPFSPEVMRYLAIVKHSVAKEHGIPQTPVTQAMADEIAASDQYALGETIGSSMHGSWLAKHIYDHTMGVPDPSRGPLSAATMSYLAEARQRMDELLGEDRAGGGLTRWPAPSEAVVDEVQAADPAVVAHALFLSLNSARWFIKELSTTPLPTPEEQEEFVQRMYDAIEFHEMGINPWRFDDMRRVMRRLERRAMVHIADDYFYGDDRLEVGGITDPPLAEQVAALTPEQLRGLCIAYAEVTAYGMVEQYRVDHDDDEAIFMAISDYREGPA
jgi:hypothetical protein